jgi:hypothetical protein
MLPGSALDKKFLERLSYRLHRQQFSTRSSRISKDFIDIALIVNLDGNAVRIGRDVEISGNLIRAYAFKLMS